MKPRFSAPEMNKIYRHYKGGLYELLYLAEHEETGQGVIVYKDINSRNVYVRPLVHWYEPVRLPTGEMVYRFELETKPII